MIRSPEGRMIFIVKTFYIAIFFICQIFLKFFIVAEIFIICIIVIITPQVMSLKLGDKFVKIIRVIYKYLYYIA